MQFLLLQFEGFDWSFPLFSFKYFVSQLPSNLTDNLLKYLMKIKDITFEYFKGSKTKVPD